MMAVYTQVVRKYLALALVLEICTTYSRPTGYLDVTVALPPKLECKQRVP